MIYGPRTWKLFIISAMLLLVSAILDACVCAYIHLAYIHLAYIHLAYIHLLHSELPRCCQFASVCVSLRLRAKLVAVYCSPGNWQLRQSVVMAHELGNCSSFRRSLPFTFNSFCSLHRDSRPFTFNSFCSLHRDSRRLERGRRTGVQPTSVGTKPTSGGTKPTLFILFPMFHLSNSQNVRQSNISAPPSAKRQAPFSNLFILFPMFHLSNSQNVRQSNISAPPSAKRQAPFSNLFLFSILLFPCHMPSPVCQGLFTIIILFDE